MLMFGVLFMSSFNLDVFRMEIVFLGIIFLNFFMRVVSWFFIVFVIWCVVIRLMYLNLFVFVIVIFCLFLVKL